MREIKFRVYDQVERRMLTNQRPPFSIRFAGDSFGVWDDCEEKDICGTSDGAILMQYTGLKDKNGKEIYEGDILCVLEDVVAEKIDGFNRYEQEGTFMEVVFDKYGRWSVRGNSMVDGELLYDELGDAQIIGNIYENPELLH